ncbi:hypothetical protein M0R72_00240 [Candidatus Pacearchaeota archaeon]|nr:hypothetical protein [Candidatus Pacearchaeota archaeon]
MGIQKDRYGRPRISSSDPRSVTTSVTESVLSVAEAADKVLKTSQGLISKGPEAMKFDDTHPEALVIQCSDGRYTPIVAELMRSNGIERYDVMAMPGGPALLDMASASILQSEACKNGTSFLVKGHGIKKIWLLAHAGCGFYKNALNGMPSQSIIDRQNNDLQRAANWLRTINPALIVAATYIEHSNGLAIFRNVAIE